MIPSSLEADPIHAALQKLGEAVAEFACAWDDESLIVRTAARRAVRDVAAALVLATSDDEGEPT